MASGKEGCVAESDGIDELIRKRGEFNALLFILTPNQWPSRSLSQRCVTQATVLPLALPSPSHPTCVLAPTIPSRPRASSRRLPPHSRCPPPFQLFPPTTVTVRPLQSHTNHRLSLHLLPNHTLLNLSFTSPPQSCTRTAPNPYIRPLPYTCPSSAPLPFTHCLSPLPPTPATLLPPNLTSPPAVPPPTGPLLCLSTPG